MCETHSVDGKERRGLRTIPVTAAVGMVLAHDITEIRKDELKDRAFQKGHIVRPEDVNHLRRLGKERLYVLDLSEDEMHENDAAYALAHALMGEGVRIAGSPREGRINILADRSGLLRIDRDALFQLNMLGEVVCATLHDGTMVKQGQTVAGTRAIPLVIKRRIVEKAVAVGRRHGSIIEVKEMKKPGAGIVITGNEVYHGRIKDAFAPVITEKIKSYDGEVVGIHYAPDDEAFITARLRDLIDAGANLLITTGGMSVDPDDVTRFAIRNLGAAELTYGSAVLPGAMFLVAYLRKSQSEAGSKVVPLHSGAIPILGIPACGMYAKVTVLDLVLPRILAGEHIGRRELAQLGHGGLCLKCMTCQYPVCPFGK